MRLLTVGVGIIKKQNHVPEYRRSLVQILARSC